MADITPKKRARNPTEKAKAAAADAASSQLDEDFEDLEIQRETPNKKGDFDISIPQ